MEYVLSESESIDTQNQQKYLESIRQVIQAMPSRKTGKISHLFTPNGLETYTDLMVGGQARTVGEPAIQCYKGSDGFVVARGVQMSFSLINGNDSFVEDVVFIFNDEGKIDGISFGLGKETTDEILNGKAVEGTEECCEKIVEFLETYKTAYSLKRFDFISDLFEENTMVICNNVRYESYKRAREQKEAMMERDGETAALNRVEKPKYLKQLNICFMRKGFVHLKYHSIDIKRVSKNGEQALYVLKLTHEYESSTVRNGGCLSLLVDFSQTHPLVLRSAWQPDVKE